MQTVSDLQRANAAIENDLCESTRKRYEGHIRRFEKWLKNNEQYSNLFEPEGSSINTIDVTEDMILAFMGSQIPSNSNEASLSSGSSMVLFRAALLRWGRKNGKHHIEGICDNLSLVIKGHKRSRAQARQNGTLATNVGKDHFTFDAYKVLALKAMTTALHGHTLLYSHLYVLLAWNLMARVTSVQHILLSHMHWDGDCLAILYPKEKTDPLGERDYPRHIFANPLQPEICPITALGIRLVTSSQVMGRCVSVIYYSDIY